MAEDSVAEGNENMAQAVQEQVYSIDTISSDVASSSEIASSYKSDSTDLAGTAADLAPYSYGFYSQNYFLESIHARAPAAFSLLS